MLYNALDVTDNHGGRGLTYLSHERHEGLYHIRIVMGTYSKTREKKRFVVYTCIHYHHLKVLVLTVG